MLFDTYCVNNSYSSDYLIYYCALNYILILEYFLRVLVLRTIVTLKFIIIYICVFWEQLFKNKFVWEHFVTFYKLK